VIRFRQARRGVSMLLAGAALVCGLGCLPGASDKGQSSRRAIEATSGIDPSITPFRLEVLEELNDGTDLTIKGRLTPKDEWPAQSVVVRLAALDDTGQQRVSYHRMSDLAPKSQTLAAGEATSFSLTLPSVGLTNYQLEVLWGRDAAPFAPKGGEAPPEARPGQQQTQPYLALRNLQVHRVPSESCSAPNECDLRFSISGEFFNSGGATVRNVVIVAGFAGADKLDLKDQILENERRVEVRNLGLRPGASKPFRLSMEKRVSALDQVAPHPVVRIVAVDSDP